MQNYLQDEKTLKECKIYQMLLENSKKKHLSFHTPGHKIGAWDITELDFSDNLASPKGCIAQAEKEIANILGAKQSFILTDGSTSGVLSMLYAAKSLGVKKIAFSINSHKSVFNGCKLLGLTPLLYDGGNENEATMSLMKDFFKEADALFFTSPNYYGYIPALQEIRAFCDKTGKLLLIDGAHGGHLHFDKKRYAGAVADLWVDGVHKSLPAFTQGAIVSARTEILAEKLLEAVGMFRTTSPSYPIMASVEYAVKYPRNLELEALASEFEKHPRILQTDDWTKMGARFGKHAYEVEKLLEEEGVYPEFCDGEILLFYLSPATPMAEFIYLKERLLSLFEAYPYSEETKRERIHTPLVLPENAETEWVVLDDAQGRVCAENCGLFPPCTPLILAGEEIKKDAIERLKRADNVFGISEGKILVLKKEE